MKKQTVEVPSLRELQTGLRIDRDDLDTEISMQADSYFRVAEACAMAASRRDEAKSKMDEEIARAGNRARVKAADEDEKLTEAQVKEQASKDTKYREAVTVYLGAKSEADLWVAMRESYDMRGKMLRELAELHIAGYYQVAAVGGRRQREVDDIARAQTRRAIRGKRGTTSDE